MKPVRSFAPKQIDLPLDAWQALDAARKLPSDSPKLSGRCSCGAATTWVRVTRGKCAELCDRCVSQ